MLHNITRFLFYLIEVCISNAHILERKSPNHTTTTTLAFRKSLISDLIEGKTFRRDTQIQQPSTSGIWFNQEHFHHLDKSSDKRSTCKVHQQHVDTFYSCAVCGVHMCLEPCFLRYHTMKDYYFSDEDSEGPWQLKEGRGRVAPQEEEEDRQTWRWKWSNQGKVIYKTMRVTNSKTFSKIILQDFVPHKIIPALAITLITQICVQRSVINL